MALPRTLSFGNVIITIDDGTFATPMVPVAPCGFLKKSVKFTAQSSDTIVPDCASPDAPAFIERNIVSLSCEVSGSGVLAEENSKFWRDFWVSGLSRPCVINFNDTGANGGFTVTGNFVLTDWSLDADKKSEGGRTQQSVTLQSDGLLTFAPNA